MKNLYGWKQSEQQYFTDKIEKYSDWLFIPIMFLIIVVMCGLLIIIK